MEHDFPELSAYLDGELDEQGRAAIEARLANDTEYAEEYAALMRVRQGLQQGIPKADYHEQVMRRIEAERFRRPRWTRWAVAAGLAAAVLLVVGVSWFLGRPGPATRVATGPAPKTFVATEQQPVSPPRPSRPSVTKPLAQETERVEKAERFEATKLPLQLVGTVTGSSPSAILTNTETGQQGTYQPGDEVLSGVSLESVESGSVVLSCGDQQIVLASSTSGSTPALSTLDGLWQGTGAFQTLGLEPESGDVTLGIAVEGAGQFVVTMLEPEKARYVFAGSIAGTYVDLTLESEGPDFPVGTQFVGRLNPEGTAVKLTSQLDESRTLVLDLHRLSDAGAEAMLAKAETEEARKAEVQAMGDALTAYAVAHEGAYPQDLTQLILEAPDNQSLFASLPGRKVTYRANSTAPRASGEPAPKWDASFMPDLPYPDRLLEYEKTLRQLYGTASPLAQPLLVVEYSSPDMCLTASANVPPGSALVPKSLAVAATALPEGLAQLDESVLGPLRAVSQNNLKQLALVIKMFENEQGGYTPGGWLSVYPEYLSDPNVLHSPIDAPGKTSYELLFPATHLAEFALSTAQLPAGVARTDPAAAGMAESQVPIIVETVEWPGAKPGRNVAFADGHVEYLSDAPYQERVVPYLKLR